MEKEYPVPVGIFRAEFSAAEERSVRCPNVEILASCPSHGEGRVGFANEVWSQLAAEGMEERRGREPSGHSRQERREEQ